jgi:cobaltochelatase CobS
MMTRAEMIGYMAPGTNEHNVGPLGEAWQEADGAVLVFDEIDAAHPAALVTLNDCLAATAGTTIRLADGTMAPRPERLFIIATANTFGTGPNAQYVGRNALDAATLDRFATVEIDYDRDTERELVGPYLNGSSAKWLDAVETMRANAESGAIRTVVSTRGVVDVAKLVHAGIPVNQAVTSRIAKGLGADQTRKLMDGVSLAGIVGRAS